MMHGHILLQRLLMARIDKRKQTYGLIATISTNKICPMFEIVQTRESQLCLRLVGIIGPHERSTLPGCSRGKILTFHHDNVLDTSFREMTSRAGPVDAS